MEKNRKKYTILLVDDEEEVIQVIMKKIDWEDLGFSVIGYASNGMKALELVEEFQPDVVVTDIKMPYMGGLELSNHIKADYPATKILLFTGFDEFEYAKEAIHLEVEEYILKPLNSVELTKVFTKLKDKLDQEISEKRNVELLQQYYLKSLPLLQANFYITLIEGRIHKEHVQRYLSDYQIAFEGPFFCCLDIHTSSGQTTQDMNPLLLGAAIQKQVRERLEERWRAKCFSYLGDTILLAELRSENEVFELTDECDRFCRYAQRIMNAEVTIGIGQVCDDILELSQSYGSSREAVSYRALYGVSRAINMKEIAPRELVKKDSGEKLELTDLWKGIRMSAEETIRMEAEKCVEWIAQKGRSLQSYQIAIIELVSELYRFSVNNDIQTAVFDGDLRKIYENLFELTTKELTLWLVKISLAFHEKLMSARSLSTQSYVFQAKEYVSNHFADEELSLDTVCEVLGVSNSYFSTTFKKETGNSFIGYVTDYRMERAARLLIETNEKSYIIAKQVGYSDPNYFSYVFKRKYHVAPSKYRTEHA